MANQIDQRRTVRWIGLVLAGVILFCVVAIVGIIGILRTPVGSTVERQPRIPESAVWYGGKGGGSWIDAVETSNDQAFHLRIYHDFTGDKEVDTWFSLSANCQEYRIPLRDIHKVIKSYDGAAVALEMTDGRRDCELKPAFPKEGTAGTRVSYEINRKKVPVEEFERLRDSLEISEEFSDGEMVKAGRTKKEAHRQGKIHLRDAVDRKTGKNYQYSISTLEDQTVYALTEDKKKRRRKN